MKAAVVLYDLLKLQNGKCQHLKDLRKSVSWGFLTAMHKLKRDVYQQNHILIKDLLVHPKDKKIQ